MLATLRIQNFAIIDRLEVEFSKGLNIITGETGAGKSMIIDALTLILGGRNRADVIRAGAEAAEVEGLFEFDADHPIASLLHERGIEFGGAMVIRRVVQSSGRTKAYINGRMVTAAELAEVAQGLVNISSQHEHHSLISPRTHLAHLDAAWAKTDKKAAVFEGYRKAYTRLLDVRGRLKHLKEQTAALADRIDYLRFQLNEIEAVGLQPGEEHSIKETKERLKHAEKLARAALLGEEILATRDGAVTDALAVIEKSLVEAAQIDRQLEPALHMLRQASDLLNELSRDLGAYGRKVVFDPQQLDLLEERWNAIQKLKRKHGDDIEVFAQKAKEELSLLENHESALDALEAERESAEHDVKTLAAALSRERVAAAKRLSEAVTQELRSLGMSTASFQVSLEALDEPGSQGAERAEFLIAPNPGEDFKPLVKVASGGELSRTMLAIKRVLTGSGDFELFVFDEVDAGVGGAIAEVIGRKLYEVSRTHQVLCITHLPQIAVFADTHFIVRKTTKNGRTFSELRPLCPQEISEEIARMLGGIKITDKTRAAAHEMLKDARS